MDTLLKMPVTISDQCIGALLWEHWEIKPVLFLRMLIRGRVHHIFAEQIHDIDHWSINLLH